MLTWAVPPGVIPPPHPQMPKATARRGTKRIPDHIREHLLPPMSQRDVVAALDEGALDPVFSKVVWNVGGRARVQSGAGVVVPDGLRLQGVRRLGTYPGAPNRIGHYPVVRDGKALLLATESRLEMAWLRWHDCQPGVDWMQTQPFVLTWDLGGRGIHMFPDFLIRWQNRWSVIDVKPDKDVDDYVSMKFDLTGRALAAAGIEHRHVGDMTRQAEVNLRVISRYKRPNPAYVELMELVEAERVGYVAELVTLVGRAGIAREALCTLIANGHCHVDLDRPVTAVTRIGWHVEGEASGK